MTAKEKKELQADIIWAASKYPFFQRNEIYAPNASDADKKNLKKDLEKFLRTNIFFKHYKSQIKKEQLLKVITKLQLSINNSHKEILISEGLSFGSMQKLVNVYLKVMWLMELTEEPPHFPIDSLILGELNLKNDTWKSLTRTTYLKTVNMVKHHPKFKDYNSFAIWEAFEYKTLKSKKSG